MNDQLTHEEAKQKAQAIKGFYQHLLVYVLVNILLFVINLLKSPGSWWFYWPLLGWGIGVIAHGLRAFLGYAGRGKS